MLRTISSAKLAKAFVRACELEVRAFKPGNVSVMSAGHGMTAQQFLVSAQAAAVPVAAAGLTVGERILRAVEATREKVGCNTNLGIVLLCAPLIHAAQSASDERKLQRRVERVLRELTQKDAEWAYRAIRLAVPGGLGNSARYDVNETPQVTLLAAMQEAKDRDSIARQYANGFADVFEFGVLRVKAALSRWGDEEAAMLAVYLGWLARFPDSHVERKFGRAVAREVSARAAAFDAKLQSGCAPRDLQAELSAFDAELKHDGINPGTSADLSVASLLALRLQDLLQKSFTGSEAKLASHRGKTKPQHVGA
ncbi:MAG TPA: triphosphoribosyl-dephospho-CoA synthase [Burkholderiales bacterium]|nr:triphosphoribosyl-dephospho-CoA synthase [Burkholderiales bacterium]